MYKLFSNILKVLPLLSLLDQPSTHPFGMGYEQMREDGSAEQADRNVAREQQQQQQQRQWQ